MIRVSMYMGGIAYYGVFDNLAYRVDGDTVSLYGQVTSPTLKSDAENVVKGLEGVTGVDNRIEVLPLSSMDDGIRIATYHTIFDKPSLRPLCHAARSPDSHHRKQQGDAGWSSCQ
jgi:hypothetical protein